ncbi:MAG: hypothetical protein LUD12_02875 [Lachnospiraceae bacterium]|nr:hypothetical protein [Lachnospiraceae bacterium]
MRAIALKRKPTRPPHGTSKKLTDVANQKISVSTASAILGIGQDEIRYRLRKEMYLPEDKRTLQIGQARKAKSGKSYRYDIYRAKVMKYAGLDEWPEEVSQ